MTTATNANELEQLIQDDQARSLFVDFLLAARREYLTVARGERVQFTVAEDPATVTDALYRAGFIGPWPFSWHYEGEDVNLVRFAYRPDQYPDLPHRQDHVRLFIDEYAPGTIGFATHSEASSVRHRDAHLDDKTYDALEGRTRVRNVLHGAGIQTKLVDDADESGEAG